MAVSLNAIADNVVLIRSEFSELLRVIVTPTEGAGFVLVNLVATRTSTFWGAPKR